MIWTPVVPGAISSSMTSLAPTSAPLCTPAVMVQLKGVLARHAAPGPTLRMKSSGVASCARAQRSEVQLSGQYGAVGQSA